MRPNNFEDVTAKALDLLPSDDPARSDPRLLRDAKCAEVMRLTQEAAADVWLATSPLRAAPPEVLSSLMSKVEAKAPLARRNVRFFPWLAASGWVAAAIAVILWPRESRPTSRIVVMDRPDEVQAAGAPATGSQAADNREFPLNPPGHRERRMRNELLSLQSRLARAGDEARMASPRVLSLSSPGAIQRTPDEARQRVWSVLTGALRSALEAESGAPDDPASLVIERGWLPEGVAMIQDGGVIRHRNFPEHSWQDLGLLRSEDGSYLDPERHLIWTPDEEGRGFIGRKANEGDDLNVFQASADDDLVAAEPAIRTQPEGFVIEDPENDLAEVVIDQVPPPAEGFEQLVMWTDASGAQNTMKVSEFSSASGEGAEGSSSHAVTQAPASHPGIGRGVSTLLFSISNSGGVKAFQLVESPIVRDGRPLKVIVSGERRSSHHVDLK